MSEMIERMAAAIAHFEINDYRTCDSPGRWNDMARAALEAIKEPTPDMLSAGFNAPFKDRAGFTQPLIIWRAMVEKAME